jgi:hypothetical protein
MWAHYGDHHKGVVIEFDETHPFFNRQKGPQDDLRRFRRVNYTDTRPSIFLSRSDAVELFYSKSKEWEYEREWRLISPLSDATTRTENTEGLPIYLFQLPSSAVRTVLFGCRVHPSQSLKLSRLIRSRIEFQHIRFDRAELDDQLFLLHRRIISIDAIDAWLSNGLCE